MKDKGFAQRLNTACDQNPQIPPYGQGRQTWVKENMGVTHEAVRKWFLGESRPRPDKMKALSAVLECDEAWLALGIKGGMDPREKRIRTINLEGAVNVVTGILQLNGANCAFPGDKDPNAGYVDIYAISRGQQLSIHVALADEGPPGQFKFMIPKEFDLCKVIGLVHARPNRVHMLAMDHENLRKYARRKGGYLEVIVNYHDGFYWSGSDKWKKIENFEKDL